MNCNRIEELLVQYLEGDLSANERRTVDAHVASCAKCRRSLETFMSLEESLGTLKETVPSWKTAEARFSRRAGLEKRRSIPAFVFNAPFVAGLSFVALGVVLFLRGNVIFPAIQSLGPRFAASFDALAQDLSRLFADAAGINVTLLIAIYGFLTFAFMCGTSALVFRFGRK
ncbi:MAG: zf-HC2 domain-containing protein [Candidatus Krumholzibacteriia bacterium]